jgi:hypothetical protein
MAGVLTFDDGALWFLPRFPFAAETTYALVSRGVPPAGIGSLGPAPLLLHLSGPPVDTTARVLEIYPTAADLPMNHLRFYVQFSAPMSEGFAARAIRLLLTSSGETLEGTILPMSPELWDRGRRRLTLLLDPGRIKRGLVPNATAGYPIEAGMDVTLMVDSSFRDSAGAELRESFHRRYRVGPALRRRVDPGLWCCDWPPAGSIKPITIGFDRPIDHALAQRCLHVFDDSTTPVAGAVSVDRGETVWRFHPARSWAAGRYSIKVDPRLEDPAGNSVRRVFDRDITETQDDPSEGTTVIEFICR